MNFRTSRGMMLSKNPTQMFGSPPVVTYSTTQRARSSGVATLTFASHAMTVGSYVNVSTVGGTGYNGWAKVASVTATQITYANVGGGGGNEGTTADTTGRVSLYPGQYDFYDVNSSMSLEQVQGLFDRIALARKSTNTIVFFADGTYNWAGPLKIQGVKTEGGWFGLAGNPFEVVVAGTRRTNQAVYLNFSGPQGISIEGCGTVYINAMKIGFPSASASNAEGYGIRVFNCVDMYLQNSFVTGSGATYGSGIVVENSFCYPYSTVFSNCRYGMHAKGKSYLFTASCGTTTPNVGTAWRAEDSSWISGGHTSYVTNYATQYTQGTYVPQWLPSTAYALGAFVSRSLPAGVKFECTRAGTSGVSEPSWPGVGSTVNDPDGSGAQWTGRTDGTLGRISVGAWW